MGLYDTINGEQIKVFYVPNIGILDIHSDNKSCVSYSGGSLSYFDEGDCVPYATDWYYLEKDFNIVDFFPYESENGPIVHIIRDGINKGCKNVFGSSPELFDVTCYDDHGNKLRMNSKDAIYYFIKINKQIQELRKNFKHDASKEYMDYIRQSTNDRNSNKYKELYYQKVKEDIENKETIKDLQNEINLFFEEDILSNVYSEFGSLVECLSRPYFKDLSIPGKRICVNDDRLVFMLGYEKLSNILKENPNFKDEYFEKLHFDHNGARKANFLKKCNEIFDNYESIKSVVFKKEQIDEQYLLNDILCGKYKEYYLKYNIVPFEGFDYDEWKYIKEASDEDYKNYCKELGKYVEKRLKEDGIRR